MSGLLMLAVAGVLFLAAYFLYGGWLCRIWGVDPKRVTPAVECNDGVDYVPAPRSVLFGHQFASIAGAGPINGPIIAAMFGWGPVLVWIIIGSIFFGAVQDFSSLFASVRSKGKGLGLIIEEYIGGAGKVLFLLFCWLFCILVIAAFSDIVASTFNGFNADGTFNDANGATATTSVLFIASAVLFAMILYRVKPGGILTQIIAIALLFLCIGLGLMFPMHLHKMPWLYLVFIYIYIASVAPVWILLQPRDYLNSFLLLFMIGAAALGIIVANPTITLPVYTGFTVNGMSLFPILFVTVACGAVSGFHSLVSSGTTSKQLADERDMRLIGFGSMLLEGFLAVIALIAVGALYNGGMPKGTPPIIFANGVAAFLGTLGISENASRTLITLAGFRLCPDFPGFRGTYRTPFPSGADPPHGCGKHRLARSAVQQIRGHVHYPDPRLSALAGRLHEYLGAVRRVQPTARRAGPHCRVRVHETHGPERKNAGHPHDRHARHHSERAGAIHHRAARQGRHT